jgi:hypothetical protein
MLCLTQTTAGHGCGFVGRIMNYPDFDLDGHVADSMMLRAAYRLFADSGARSMNLRVRSICLMGGILAKQPSTIYYLLMDSFYTAVMNFEGVAPTSQSQRSLTGHQGHAPHTDTTFRIPGVIHSASRSGLSDIQGLVVSLESTSQRKQRVATCNSGPADNQEREKNSSRPHSPTTLDF